MTVWTMDDEDAQDVRRIVIAAMRRQDNDFRLAEPGLLPPHTAACDHEPCAHPREPVRSWADPPA
jgi:hypothetical protein